jgi:hypothetical protein
MAVSIAYIPKEQADEARRCASALAKAVEDGAMNSVDSETARLRSLAAEEIRVSEAVWRKFLTNVREAVGAFSADYLLGGEQLEAILRLTPEPAQDEILRIARTAYEHEGLMLELPGTEDADDEQ